MDASPPACCALGSGAGSQAPAMEYVIVAE